MKIPVRWFGYYERWSEATFIKIFNQEFYKPAHTYIFEKVDEIGEGKGGIVIVTDNPPFDGVQEQINKMSWVLFIVMSDEGLNFKYYNLKHENMRIWLQYPHQKKNGQNLSDERITRYLGAYLIYGCSERLQKYRNMDRKLLWCFNGQATLAKRKECIKVLEDIKGEDTLLLTYAGFNKGTMSVDEYMKTLSTVKVVPCPSGGRTADSFRFWEAMEAGCIPVPDRRNIYDSPEFNYWELIFDTKDLPFKTVDNWEEFKDIVEEYKDHLTWLRAANRINAFWQTEKRRLVCDLHDEIRDLLEIKPESGELKDKVTILMSTASIPTHPSTEIIEKTVDSIRNRPDLKDVEIILMIDEIRDEFKHRILDYEKYIQRVLWLCNFKWKNVLPIISKEWLHQALLTKRVMKYVRTKNVFFIEHDTPLIGEINFKELCDVMDDSRVNYLRFHYSEFIHPAHQYLMCGKEIIKGIQLIKTIQWSQRPHLAKTKFYNELLNKYFGEKCRTMIEDVIYGVIHADRSRDYGLWIYAPEGGIKRSMTNDGRRKGDYRDEKFKMLFARPE